MSKVVWHVTMSVDGFIAGPGGELDWVFAHHGGPNAEVEEVLRTTGAFLAGRGSLRGEGEEVFGGAWDGPIFVLAHEPPEGAGEGEGGARVRYRSGDVGPVVAEALAAAGDGNLVVTGGDVPRQCVGAGLVDELLIHVAPILLGEGTRLYDAAGSRILLERIRSSEAGPITNLRFRVANEP
jgi:dihydrofolate reductase